MIGIRTNRTSIKTVVESNMADRGTGEAVESIDGKAGSAYQAGLP